MSPPSALPAAVTRVLRTDAEYDAAHAELLTLLDADPEPDTPAGDRLELLTMLIAAYDREHVRFGETSVTPQEAVQVLLDMRRLTRGDLLPVFGSKSRVSEFFSNTRPLSMGQLQNLRAFFHAPADLFLAPAPATVNPLAAQADSVSSWPLRVGEQAEGRDVPPGHTQVTRPAAERFPSTKPSSVMRSGGTASKSKSAAGGALSQTRARKKSGSKSATKVSSTLRDGRTSARSAAGSALSQKSTKARGGKGATRRGK